MLFLFIVTIAVVNLFAATYNQPLLFTDSLQNGVGIEKTMAKLAAGGAVKIAYFGQSIISSTGVVNWWPDTITNYLKATYPTASITATNAAISGSDAKAMVDQKIVSKKLAPLSPDLIVLYIYFHLENEMETMIRQIDSLLPSAEMVILNFHYSLPKDSHWNATAQKSEVPWEDALSWDYLPWLCEKYHCGYLDIRTPWIKYITDFCAGVDILTNSADGIHLSPQGQWLMAEFAKPYFVVKKNDNVQPMIDSIYGLGNKLWIRFNEKMDTLSTLSPANYVIDQGAITVTNVSLNPDRRTIVVVLGYSMGEGAHSVNISNVKDRAGNAIAANTQKSVTIMWSLGWSSCDIGRVFTPGSMTYVPHGFMIKAGGEHASPMNCAWGATSMTNRCDPFWMWRNEFHYTYINIAPDSSFEIIAQISDMDSLDSNSQAGIMIREDLQYLSRFAAIDVFKKNGGYFEYVKRTDLWDTIVTMKPRAAKSVPLWLKLARTGGSDTIEAFSSVNGQAWTSEGKTAVKMIDQVTAGLFVCGNEYAAGPFSAKFSNISVGGTSGTVFPGSFVSGCAKGAPRIAIAGKSLIISGLKEGQLSEIDIYNAAGRSLLSAQTRQMSFSIPLSRLAGGVHIIAIRGTATAYYFKCIR